jgi:hypothetical protein
MKIHTDIQQGSPEWSILRSGKVTASEMDSLVTPLGKVKTGDGPKTYLMQKLAETWIGGGLPSVQGIWDMEQGSMLESYARPAFTLETGLEVAQVAFIESDDGFTGCSPDGLISGHTGLEIKAPRLETHIRYLLDGVLPSDYRIQVQASMWVSGLKQWYFCSFRRNFPPFILLVQKDEAIHEALSEAVAEFRSNFDSAMAKLISINGGPPNPRNRGLAPFPAKYTASMDVIP